MRSPTHRGGLDDVWSAPSPPPGRTSKSLAWAPLTPAILTRVSWPSELRSGRRRPPSRPEGFSGFLRSPVAFKRANRGLPGPNTHSDRARYDGNRAGQGFWESRRLLARQKIGRRWTGRRWWARPATGDLRACSEGPRGYGRPVVGPFGARPKGREGFGGILTPVSRE